MAQPITSAKPRRRGTSPGGGRRRLPTKGGSARRSSAGGARRRFKRRHGHSVLVVPYRSLRLRRRRRAYPVALARWARGCVAPVSPDCRRLQITGSWAVGCFMPRFYELRSAYGSDYHGIVNDIILQETPQCHLVPQSPAEREFQRRVALAVGLLLMRDGYAVNLPPMPSTHRPVQADRIRQPWLRALLTGWI